MVFGVRQGLFQVLICAHPVLEGSAYEAQELAVVTVVKDGMDRCWLDVC